MLLTLSSNVYHSLENTIFSGLFDWKSHLPYDIQKMDRDKQKSWLTWQTLHVTIGAPPVTDVYGGGSSSTVPCTIPPGPTVRETESSGPTESSKKIHIIVNFKNLRHFLLFIIWKKEKTLRMSHPTSHYGRCWRAISTCAIWIESRITTITSVVHQRRSLSWMHL